MDEQARMKILDMIEKGTISAEEGLQLLQALSKSEELEADLGVADSGTSSEPSIDNTPPSKAPFFVIEKSSKPSESVKSAMENPTDQTASEPASADFQETASGASSTNESVPHEEPVNQTETANTSYQSSTPNFSPLPADVEKWRRWWMIPLWVGVGMTVLTGALMYWSFTGQGFGFWFVCLWFPFLLGVALMALSYGSRRSRWLHVRVDQKPGERPQHIAISMPLPIRFATWFFHNFGHYIPDLQDKPIEEILHAVNENTNAENPFYVEVDEGDGEHVRVYIG